MEDEEEEEEGSPVEEEAEQHPSTVPQQHVTGKGVFVCVCYVGRRLPSPTALFSIFLTTQILWNAQLQQRSTATHLVFSIPYH